MQPRQKLGWFPTTRDIQLAGLFRLNAPETGLVSAVTHTPIRQKPGWFLQPRTLTTVLSPSSRGRST
eukprot:COSAG03_NODE_23937_length_276_cov_0.570621_1_plen_66_part_01